MKSQGKARRRIIVCKQRFPRVLSDAVARAKVALLPPSASPRSSLKRRHPGRLPVPRRRRRWIRWSTSTAPSSFPRDSASSRPTSRGPLREIRTAVRVSRRRRRAAALPAEENPRRPSTTTLAPPHPPRRRPRGKNLSSNTNWNASDLAASTNWPFPSRPVTPTTKRKMRRTMPSSNAGCRAVPRNALRPNPRTTKTNGR